MLGLLIALLVIDTLLLAAVILLQPGRDQGIVGIGSAYATTLLGGKGGVEFLTKATIVLSVIWVALIIGINVYISGARYSAPTMERPAPSVPLPSSPAGE